MNRILAVMILLGIPCCAQSVADAARAAQRRSAVDKTKKRKVIADDDLPATSKTDVALGPALDSELQAPMDHFRAVYMDICSDPSLKNTQEFSPDANCRLESGHAIAHSLSTAHGRIEVL
jgi:hypothetical protein